jgi:hypothetical protein
MWSTSYQEKTHLKFWKAFSSISGKPSSITYECMVYECMVYECMVYECMVYECMVYGA